MRACCEHCHSAIRPQWPIGAENMAKSDRRKQQIGLLPAVGCGQFRTWVEMLDADSAEASRSSVVDRGRNEVVSSDRYHILLFRATNLITGAKPRAFG